MNDELPRDIEALLAAEREAPGAPAAARARLSRRLEAIAQAQAPPKRPTGAAGKALLVVAIAAGAGWLLWPAPGPALAPVVADRVPAEAAPVLEAAPEPTPVPAVASATAPRPRDLPASEPAAAAEPAPATEALVPPEPAPTAGGPPAAPPAAEALPNPRPAPSADAALAPLDLDAERRLVDGARASLSAGGPAEALRTLRDHRQRFPRGALVEERESLRVRATAALGRPAEAARLRRAFLARWPQSVYRASLESLPGLP